MNINDKRISALEAEKAHLMSSVEIWKEFAGIWERSSNMWHARVNELKQENEVLRNELEKREKYSLELEQDLGM